MRLIARGGRGRAVGGGKGDGGGGGRSLGRHDAFTSTVVAMMVLQPFLHLARAQQVTVPLTFSSTASLAALNGTWNTNVRQVCAQAARKVGASVGNEAGVLACYNVASLEETTGLFAGDLRLYSASASSMPPGSTVRLNIDFGGTVIIRSVNETGTAGDAGSAGPTPQKRDRVVVDDEGQAFERRTSGLWRRQLQVINQGAAVPLYVCRGKLQYVVTDVLRSSTAAVKKPPTNGQNQAAPNKAPANAVVAGAGVGVSKPTPGPPIKPAPAPAPVAVAVAVAPGPILQPSSFVGPVPGSAATVPAPAAGLVGQSASVLNPPTPESPGVAAVLPGEKTLKLGTAASKAQQVSPVTQGQAPGQALPSSPPPPLSQPQAQLQVDAAGQKNGVGTGGKVAGQVTSSTSQPTGQELETFQFIGQIDLAAALANANKLGARSALLPRIQLLVDTPGQVRRAVDMTSSGVVGSSSGVSTSSTGSSTAAYVTGIQGGTTVPSGTFVLPGRILGGADHSTNLVGLGVVGAWGILFVSVLGLGTLARLKQRREYRRQAARAGTRYAIRKQ